ADEQAVLGLVDLYLAVLDDHAYRIRQPPDPAGDVGGRRRPGTAGPRLVLHPDLVRADADAVLVPLHEVDVQAFRMIHPAAQVVVVAQRGARGPDVDCVKVMTVVEQYDQVRDAAEHEVLVGGDALELPPGPERDADRAAGGRDPLRPVVGQHDVRVAAQ